MRKLLFLIFLAPVSAFASIEPIRPGQGPSPILTVTSNYTATGSDATIFANCSSNGGCVVTLPAANALVGQQIAVTKIDSSSQPVIVNAAGSDLVVSTRGFVMYAQGQRIQLVNDGSSKWYPNGSLPYTIDYLGYRGEPNSATGVAASSNTQYCPFTVTEPVFVTGMRMSFGAAHTTIDVGIMDQYGVKIASSGAATVPGTGLRTILFKGVDGVPTGLTLLPGIYWSAMTVANPGTTITRFGTGGSNLGCAVETGSSTYIPAVGVLTGVGSGVRQFSFEVITAGGVAL